MPLTSVTVTGSYVSGAQPARGSVTFRLNQALVNSVGTVLAPMADIVCPLVAGAFTRVIEATNDPGTLPNNATYNVTEVIEGAPRRVYSIPLVYTVTAVDLSSFAPTTTPPPGATTRALTDVTETYPQPGQYLVYDATKGAYSPNREVARLPTGGTSGQSLTKTTGANFDVGWTTVTGGPGGGVSSVSGVAPIVSSGGLTPAISITAASGAAPGSMSAADKAKLDGVAVGATANLGTVTGVTATAPATSTGGVAPVIGVTLGTTAASAAAGNDARLSDPRTPLDNSVTSAKIVDGTIVDADVNAGAAIGPAKIGGTGTRDTTTFLRGDSTWTVPPGTGVTAVGATAPITSSGGLAPTIGITAATGIAAGSLSAADKAKLDGVATGATANSSDAVLLARANHTGTEPANTVPLVALTATGTRDATTFLRGDNSFAVPAGGGGGGWPPPYLIATFR